MAGWLPMSSVPFAAMSQHHYSQLLSPPLTATTSVLIVDGAPSQSEPLSDGLRAHGFQPAITCHGATALNMGRQQSFDVVIVDLGLSETDVFETMRQLRRQLTDAIIIATSTYYRVEDAVATFEAAADDFIIRPLFVEDLVARIKSRISGRRRSEPTVLKAGHITLDLTSKRVETPAGLVDLTAREFALAETFLRHRGQVLSQDQLLSQVWGHDQYPASNVIAVHIRTLRRKLGPGTIQTVRGLGYRFDVLERGINDKPPPRQ